MKISIITATLNSGQFLQECIDSVLCQDDTSFEHIVVDGGSTDDTLQIARANRHLLVMERPGCSIYEAWNIGLEFATGDLIGFCNSDDYYSPRALKLVRQAASARADAWMISGNAILFVRDAFGNKTVLAQFCDRAPNRLHFEDLDLFGPAPNARFFTRDLIAKIGQFDTRFRLAADCAYLMEIAILRLPVTHVPEVIYWYRSHSKSTTLGGNIDIQTAALDEKLTIAHEFINKHDLQSSELHHLHRAMTLQLLSTAVENVQRRRWSEAVSVLGRLRSFGSAGLIAAFGEACRFAARGVARRLAPSVPSNQSR
jgi:glycosyltransferase involved in cell wall biosynthesis